MYFLMKLSFPDRLRLAWELTWPLALADLAAVVLFHGVIGTEGELLDTVWAVAAFFAVSPWVVRRAFRRERIVAVRNGKQLPQLDYQQSIKVIWLLAWRTIPLGLLALLAVSAAFRFTGTSLPSVTTKDPLVNAFGLSVVDTIASLVLYPVLIPGMLKKRYRGFHLELRPAK